MIVPGATPPLQAPRQTPTLSFTFFGGKIEKRVLPPIPMNNNVIDCVIFAKKTKMRGGNFKAVPT
jgi:hypothetical protein